MAASSTEKATNRFNMGVLMSLIGVHAERIPDVPIIDPTFRAVQSRINDSMRTTRILEVVTRERVEQVADFIHHNPRQSSSARRISRRLGIARNHVELAIIVLDNEHRIRRKQGVIIDAT